MKQKNSNLHLAKKVKNDEFFTLLTDIEKELKNYRNFFKDKIVYCNCDKFLMEGQSNFFYHFSQMFKVYGLKELITSYYNPNGKGKVCFFFGDMTDDNMPDETKIQTFELESNGSFYDKECLKFLERADIVVTNPPFSLFRKYVSTLMEYNKKFLIIGNKNAITYKEIFSLIKENKMWLGYNSPHTFITNELINKNCYIGEDGKIYANFGNIGWFTNLEHDKRGEELLLYKKYNSELYSKYDNYDAININKVTDIPMDYNEVMGVPITFLDKYNPKQFEIIGMSSSAGYNKTIVNLPLLKEGDARPLINGKNTYARIFIRKVK